MKSKMMYGSTMTQERERERERERVNFARRINVNRVERVETAASLAIESYSALLCREIDDGPKGEGEGEEEDHSELVGSSSSGTGCKSS
jgi:hypothetical protein